MMRHSWLLLAWVVGCAGSTEAGSEAPVPVETSGGEEELPPPSVMRTTTPVPVPQPAVARETLSAPLQSLWERVELSVSHGPPAAPADITMESVTAWAEQELRAWIESRVRDNAAVTELATQLTEAPIHERVVGAALSGYLLEDTAAVLRGSPVPPEVATDAELLGIYESTLIEMTKPVAQLAFDAYAFCASHGATVLGETEWASWAVYCYERASDVHAAFELTHQPAPGANAASPGANAASAPPGSSPASAP